MSHKLTAWTPGSAIGTAIAFVGDVRPRPPVRRPAAPLSFVISRRAPTHTMCCNSGLHEGGTMTTAAAPAKVLGRHVWSELMTTDPKAAETFYDTVVGWTSQPAPNSPQPYTQFNRSGGAGVAGLMATPH